MSPGKARAVCEGEADTRRECCRHVDPLSHLTELRCCARRRPLVHTREKLAALLCCVPLLSLRLWSISSGSSSCGSGTQGDNQVDSVCRITSGAYTHPVPFHHLLFPFLQVFLIFFVCVVSHSSLSLTFVSLWHLSSVHSARTVFEEKIKWTM